MKYYLKKLLVLGVVGLLACICVQASDINPGQTFTDGQKLTAAELNALVGQAQILPSFFTGQVAAPSNLASSDLILTVNGTGQFRKMAGSQIISAPAFFTNSAISTNFQPYSYLIYWNPSNTTVFQIAGSNFGFMISSNLVPTNIPFATTNGNNLTAYTNTPSASNTTYQVLFPVYDTNGGILYNLPFTNLVADSASQLGSNNLVPWIYTNTFFPWFITKIQATNFWQFPTNFAITNIAMTNTNGVTITNRTLVDSDQIPINSGPQATNTTVTLKALNQYLQTNNPIISASYTMPLASLLGSAGQVTNSAHGLGVTPRFVRWVLVCGTNDVGYVVGDEVDITGFDGGQFPAFTVGANATSIFMSQPNGTIAVNNKTTGSRAATITNNRWAVKAYAIP